MSHTLLHQLFRGFRHYFDRGQWSLATTAPIGPRPASIDRYKLMQPFNQRQRSGRYAAVPLHVALCLCLGAFLAGRWLTRISGPAAPAMHDGTNKGKDLALDAVGQQLLQQSGLLQHRPPLQPGASGNPHYTLAPYQILSWYPRVVVFPEFIDSARVAVIVQLAKGRLQPSTVRIQGDPGDHNERAEGRSSSGVFLTPDDDPSGSLAWLERKIQDVTLLPASHGEKFYVIKYQPGDKYDPHMDPHDNAESGQESKRVATVVVYLNDVGSGGETLFPREGRDAADLPVGPSSCSSGQGLRYKPRKGDAVLFYSQQPDLTLDPRSVHAGCPVGKGSEKWVVTKWIRDKPLVASGGFGWSN